MKVRSSISKGTVSKGTASPRNYNVKPPKLGGGLSKKAPASISKALGISPGMPVHQQMVSKLLNHPDTNVANAAKRLMKQY